VLQRSGLDLLNVLAGLETISSWLTFCFTLCTTSTRGCILIPSLATVSVVCIGFGSVAGIVDGEGSLPISVSITASSIAMGHSVPTSNSGFSTMAVEPWTTVRIAPLGGGFYILGSGSHGTGLLVSRTCIAFDVAYFLIYKP
jgi:hypothetical protein